MSLLTDDEAWLLTRADNLDELRAIEAKVIQKLIGMKVEPVATVWKSDLNRFQRFGGGIDYSLPVGKGRDTPIHTAEQLAAVVAQKNSEIEYFRNLLIAERTHSLDQLSAAVMQERERCARIIQDEEEDGVPLETLANLIRAGEHTK